MQITIPYETGLRSEPDPEGRTPGELRDRNVRLKSDLIKKHRTAFGKWSLAQLVLKFWEFSFPLTAKDIHLAIDWQKWSVGPRVARWSFSQKLFGTHLWTQTHTHTHTSALRVAYPAGEIGWNCNHQMPPEEPKGKPGHWAISLATLTGTAADASAQIVGPSSE